VKEIFESAQHPFLLQPSRQKAFADLANNGTGTYRAWAKRWGWSVSRVQRFISALDRLGIAMVTRTPYGTMIRVRITADSRIRNASASLSNRNEFDPDSETNHLGSQTRSTTILGPRGVESAEEQTVESYTVACISVINEQLKSRFGPRFSPIRFDNLGSAGAGARLHAAGVELKFAIAKLRKDCADFNPVRQGRGQLPGSLAYFEKSLLKAHANRPRAHAREEPGDGSHPAKREPCSRPTGPEVKELLAKGFSDGVANGRYGRAE
jgi:hypothetical protein